MTAATPGRVVIDVTADLLADNDDAPAPGRILLLGDCPICGGHRIRLGTLGGGRWAIDHTHDGRWSAHLLRFATPVAAVPVPDDVAALAAAVAPALAGARR